MITKIALLAGLVSAAAAQVPAVPNSDFPTFRINLNNSLAVAANTQTNYSNPSFIANLDWSKIVNITVANPVTYNANTKILGFVYAFSQSPAAGQVPIVNSGGQLSIPGGVLTGNPVAFGSLPTATFPMLVACSDCTVGSTCSGMGSGAYAFATATGAWTCPF